MSKRQGFTLVELIVVLVILAVLAALAVPALTGYIDKANAAKCMSNRRYAYVDLTADYLFDGAAALPSANQEDLCQNPDYSQYKCPTGGKLSYRLNEEERQIEVFCSEHYNSGSLGVVPIRETVLATMAEVMKRTDKQGKVTYIYKLDSGAMNINNSFAGAFKARMKDQGLDLEAMGAVSWYYDNSTSSSGTRNNSLYWTDVDINQLSVGNPVAVIKYNGKQDSEFCGIYSVWKANVVMRERVNDDGTTDSYKVIQPISEYSVSSKANKEDKTYEAALKWLADEQAKLDKKK